MKPFYGVLAGIVLMPGAHLWAHDTPVQLPEPGSVGEAWNVIEESRGNVDQLIGGNLMRDVGGQLANISRALRYVRAHADGEKAEEIRAACDPLVAGLGDILRASREEVTPQEKTSAAWKTWCAGLGNLETLYPPEVLKTSVYICPMHPLDRHLDPTDKCSICGMALVKRHLPASAIYQHPGQPTMNITLAAPPLVVGERTRVVLKLSKSDGSPVLLSDLLETHTKKIHLLINDASLADYHHEHPVPTGTAGEYAFEFTPRRPGPYRVWADVVPSVSGVQEYDIGDISAGTQGRAIGDRQTRLAGTVDGRTFVLGFPGTTVLKAGVTYVGTISVTGADGTGFVGLEPVMGAFAHLVGFSEDGKTVLHIHPSGKEPTSESDRAGPAFAFKFYAPAPGFWRLYCQVRIGGGDVFVPFNLTVAPRLP